MFKSVKPRTWLEKRKARKSMVAYIIFRLVTLAILSIAIVLLTNVLPAS